MAVVISSPVRARVLSPRGRLVRYVLLALLCVALLLLTAPRPRTMTPAPVGGTHVHEALRNDAHGAVKLDEDAPPAEPQAEHLVKLADDPLGGKPTPEPAPAGDGSGGDDGGGGGGAGLSKAERLKAAVERADEKCEFLPLPIGELEELAKAMYSSTGGEHQRCIPMLRPIDRFLPITPNPVHPRCASARLPPELLPRRRKRGRRDMWPSLKDHLNAIDQAGIYEARRVTQMLYTVCRPEPQVEHLYFDVGPTEGPGSGPSLEWFATSYPDAATFKMFAIAPDWELERLRPAVDKLNVQLADELKRMREREGHFDIAPDPAGLAASDAGGKAMKKKRKTTPPPTRFYDHVLESTLPPRRGETPAPTLPKAVGPITLVEGLAWNETGYVTQLVAVPPKPAPPEDAPDEGPKKGRRGGRIDIVIGATPEPSEAPPTRFPVRIDPPEVDPMIAVVNDRMLPAQFHVHPALLDRAALNATADAMDDSLAKRFPREARTTPAVDLSELIMRHARREDHVVLRLNAHGHEWMLVERLLATGAMRLVDEVFLVCRCLEQDLAWNTPVTPRQCQDLLYTLRNAGIYVHQWYAFG